MIFQFFLIAALLFAGFRALSFLAGRLTVLPMRLRYHIRYLLPVAELVAWIALLLWMARAIYVSQNYFALLSLAILFVLLAVPLFFLIRNFIAGIILRLQNRIVEGMYVDIEGIAGEVKKTGHLGLEIEDRQRNIRTIPYHTIRSKSILRQGDNPHLDKVTIRFTLPETPLVSELSARLQQEVLNTPWVAVSQPPVIESASIKKGKTIIEVGVFMPNRKYADQVRATVLQALSD